MVRVFGRNQVADYDTWRKAYDAFDRESRGVRQDAVYRSSSDPNEVTVTFDLDDQETAEAFIGSDELRARMKEAGVVMPPTFWFTTEA